MSDLFVTDYTPTLGVGRALRVYSIIRALAKLGPVDVLYVRFGAEEPAPEYREDPNIRLHSVESSRGLGRAVAVLGSRLAGAPIQLAKAASPELLARARELAPAPGTGRIIADGTGPRTALRSFERTHGVIISTHNLESSFQDQLGDEKLATQKQMEKFERKLFERSSESWMVSHADIAGGRALAPNATFRYVPNVVDVSTIAPIRPLPRTQRALLVAGFDWPPNREAARWLLDEIMPRVWRELPEARLQLVGRGLELPDGVDPRIERPGFVPDLRDAYSEAACAVVPLLSGGGSPLKFVEGLAYGLPIVATPVAAQGLELVEGKHYLGGDGPDAYAAALVKVLRDGAPEVADAGRRIAEEAYSVETLVRLLGPDAAPLSRAA